MLNIYKNSNQPKHKKFPTNVLEFFSISFFSIIDILNHV